MSNITFYHILKYLHLIGLIFVVGNTFCVIGLNSFTKTMNVKFSTYYHMIKRFNRLLTVGLVTSIVSGLLMLFYIHVVHPFFDIKMTFLVINLIIIGWTSHGTLAKYKKNIADGKNTSDEFDKLDAKFVNGFVISAVLWLLIIALALLV
jgi:hypothetical protein